MNEAWIVAAGRSPIGRAGKGSLVALRPDDLAAYVATEVLKRVPQLPAADIEDLICGCAMPNAEQGWNMGRAISLIAGLDTPGTTVNRYCSSSLQTTRMAAHAIKAGEGDAFLSVGVESISRYYQGQPDVAEAVNPRLRPGNPEHLADYYISMGLTAENVADREHISREEMDRFACLSQGRAEAAQAGG
ncbi:MAG: beta-ketoacyl synthase N-terminal-like domain-containing protein, partial [Chloroflexota bacterium]